MNAVGKRLMKWIRRNQRKLEGHKTRAKRNKPDF